MARSIWSGAISFGLVNIPVKLYTAVRSNDIRFHMLHAKDGVRVRQKLVCPLDDKDVEREETVRGYEVAPDQYVTVSDDELDALAPEASRSIAISDFVDLKKIDPVYYDRPYYMLPDENAVKPYKLLMEAMEQSGKVAIAKFVMRGKEYLAALRPAQGVLLLEIMHFAEEVVEAGSVGALPTNIKTTSGELKMAQQLIDAMADDFDPQKYRDEYTQKVQEMLEKKAKGEVISVAPQPKRPQKVINLMDALKQSLREAGKGEKIAQVEQVAQAARKAKSKAGGAAKAKSKKRKTA